jgi:hypothetical protein
MLPGKVHVVEGLLMVRSKIDELEQRIYEGFAESIRKLNDLEKWTTSLASPSLQSAPNNATNDSNDTRETPKKDTSQAEPTTGSLTKNPMKWKPTSEDLASPFFRSIHGIRSPWEDALKQLYRETPDVYREVLPERPFNNLEPILKIGEEVYNISQVQRKKNQNVTIIPTWVSTFFSSRGLMMACLGCLGGCWTARERKRRGQAPIYGTAWMAGKSADQSPV